MKGKIQTIALLLIMSLSSCNFLESSMVAFTEEALTDTTFTTEIPQKIGGTLICEVDYSNDFHSWDYHIDYKYKDKANQVLALGSGLYSGEEWHKKEQIQLVGDWAILKTSSNRNSDKLIIGKITNSEKWNEFDFSPQTIESEKIWQNKNINSEPNNYDSKAKVVDIDTKGIITVNYNFAKKDRIFSFMEGERKILYRVNVVTGKPQMAGIVEK